MSRTLKDRPYSVLKNDPKMARYASHHHIASRREKVGEEVITRDGYDKNGKLIHDIPYWTCPLYKHWVEDVECTLEAPESPDKFCYWWLEYYPNDHSKKDFKSLTNRAVRSSIRQQLHNAIRDNGSWTEPGMWWYSDDYTDVGNPWPEYICWDEVDIWLDTKYVSRGWWD